MVTPFLLLTNTKMRKNDALYQEKIVFASF